jgi:hypothetical protein
MDRYGGRAAVLPIRTERSNFIYRSSRPDAPDMPGEKVEPGHIRSIWTLTVPEREAIIEGLNVELSMFAEPIPPVSLGITYEGATLLRRRPILVAEVLAGDDGQWHVRMLSEAGAELGLSKGYTHKWSARLAQRCLQKILPELEMWSS